MQLLLIVCVLVSGTPKQHASAYQHFQANIPNGDRVVTGGSLWPGVGHLLRIGSGTRNQFGRDFKAAGFAWTAALCHMDSDGDGYSNGQELGDPLCAWQSGSVPERVVNITNPGVKDGPPGSNLAFEEPATGLFGAPQWYGTHATLMLSSWIVVIPIGILFPVFCKPRSKGPTWLHLHRLFMGVGLVLFVAGFAVATANQEGSHFATTHSQLGLATIMLGLLQPINGFLRPHAPQADEVKSSVRLLWEQAHRGLGRLSVVLATAAAMLGFRDNLKGFVSDSTADSYMTAVGIVIGTWAALIIVQKLILFSRASGAAKSAERNPEFQLDQKLAASIGKPTDDMVPRVCYNLHAEL